MMQSLRSWDRLGAFLLSKLSGLASHLELISQCQDTNRILELLTLDTIPGLFQPAILVLDNPQYMVLANKWRVDSVHRGRVRPLVPSCQP